VGAVVSFVIGMVIAGLTTPLLAVVGRRVGLVDRPGSLKIHDRPVPVTGGVAVAMAALAALEVSDVLDAWVAAAVILALAVGTIDDLAGLSPIVRLASQSAAGAALAASGMTLEPLGVFAEAAIVLVVAATCNAVNLMDGQDGLAGGVAVISSLGLAAVSFQVGEPSVIPLASAGAAAGFLVWNRPPARVFLGDGGAYVLAILLSAGVAHASRSGWPGLLAAGACVGPFAYELLSSIVRRAASNAPATSGDRDHSYDRLARALGSRDASTVLMFAVAVVAAVIGWAAAALTAGAGLFLVAGATSIAVLLDAALLRAHGMRRTA
jgi:UDP-GlcNAc:undecaprenyl-phosphate GlcNAc-1-phosphate transferase